MTQKQQQPKVNVELSHILGAVAVVILTLVLFYLWRRRRSTRRYILLTGLSDSGKTLLFLQLVHKRATQTFTSIQENVGLYRPGDSASLLIADLPGHDRLRRKSLEKWLDQARAVVFVVDSETVARDSRDAAEFLHDVLIEASGLPVLLLCTKQDLEGAPEPEQVAASLEKELETVRFTKSKGLASVDGNEGGGSKVLEAEDGGFSFEGAGIEVAGCSARDGDIESLKEWLMQFG